MKSNFAILDVTKGRKTLRRRLGRGETVHVRLEGVLADDHGNDDGVSQEFALDVEKIEEVKGR